MGKEMNFAKGTEIEICSNDNTWYAATVVRSVPKTGRVTVKYQTLLSNENPSKPLKESVDLSQVRPRPPPDDKSDRIFELDDEVDALCSDAWRVGKISMVLENSMFLVIFLNTKEEMEFGGSGLRVHRDWIAGRWVSSKEQRMLEMQFGNGTSVEVSSEDEGFEGALFVATIVRAVGKNKFLVEYQDLRTDDENELLRETVYSQHIRPVPPSIPEVKTFSLLEEVDAWYNDGWWIGVISKVLKDSWYIVYFRQTSEELEFRHSDLRPHQDWINGKWIRASQELKLCSH